MQKTHTHNKMSTTEDLSIKPYIFEPERAGW